MFHCSLIVAANESSHKKVSHSSKSMPSIVLISQWSEALNCSFLAKSILIWISHFLFLLNSSVPLALKCSNTFCRDTHLMLLGSRVLITYLMMSLLLFEYAKPISCIVSLKVLMRSFFLYVSGESSPVGT